MDKKTIRNCYKSSDEKHRRYLPCARFAELTTMTDILSLPLKLYEQPSTRLLLIIFCEKSQKQGNQLIHVEETLELVPRFDPGEWLFIFSEKCGITTTLKTCMKPCSG